MAATDWNDLYVRTSLDETGPAQRAGALGSPDIIPVGTSPKPWQDYATEDSYKRYYQEAFLEHKPNYVYVRARNSSKMESATGRARLVMCDPAVVLWPGGSDWTPINTSTGSDHCVLEEIEPGTIGVTQDPFEVVPETSGHRCLVTWLSTAKHSCPDNPGRITEVDKLVAFLKDHPNYAHHNIDVVPDTTGVHTFSRPFTSGDQPAKWVFTLKVTQCKGYEVSFSCGTRLATGQYIRLDPVTVTTNDEIGLTIDRDVEAGFDSTISYTFDQKNLPLRPGFKVEFKAARALPKSHPLHAYGYRYHTWDREKGLTLSDHTAFDVGSLVVVGKS
ncbi:hypothetical protein [Streptomyces sp. BRA346]|uniref:hypothetical protein n=1 Tax=Streptomyces sp. BRA346 TaxID=2878199 RepID=UPI004063DAB7